MSLFKEIDDLKNQLFPWLVAFIVVALVFFSTGFETLSIWGKSFYFPIFSAHSLAAICFDIFKNNLLPEHVVLVATSPTSVFSSEMNISFLGSFILTFPYLLYTLSRYLSPALYTSEKKVTLKLLIPSSLLFVSGAIFAYFIVIPPLFKVLYSFNLALGVAPFLHVDEFISWTLSIMFVTGTAFLLPIFMYLASWVGLIDHHFWSRHWRGAVMIFLIVSAILTPDPSGLVMILISLPLCALYGAGYALSRIAPSGRADVVHKRRV